MRNELGASTGRLDYLDALRGLAALYVLAMHTAILPAITVPRWAQPLTYFGGSGVTLFFVISGFSLAMTMPRHVESGMPLRHFYVTRLARIAPLFLVITAVTIIRDIYVYGRWHSADEIAENVLMIFNFIPGRQEAIAWAGWTIGVEVIFYALFPLLYARLDSLPKLAAAIFLTCALSVAAPQVLSSLHVDPGYYTWTIVRHLPVFLIGMATYQITEALRTRAVTSAGGLFIAAAGVLGLAMAVAGQTPTFLFPAYYWQAIFYAMLVSGIALSNAAGAPVKAAAALGRTSYSMYLLHPLAIVALMPMYTWMKGWTAPPTVAFAFAILATAAVVSVAATATYYCIERPGIRLGRRALTRLSAPIYSPGFGA